MKSRNAVLALATLALSSCCWSLCAQLVADGATATINATSTNLTGNLIVGTNGILTTLVVTNGGTVTNSGNGIIGQNFAAQSNRVFVTGSSSAWKVGGNLSVGDSGAYSLLVVTNGGRFDSGNANIGQNSSSAGNAVIVTGGNSVWTNRSAISLGNLGPLNRLVVSNGGAVGTFQVINIGFSSPSNALFVTAGSKVWSGSGRLGYNFAGQGNLAVVADPGSEWKMDGQLNLGVSGNFNQLFLTNGAKIVSVGAHVGNQSNGGGSGSTNLVMIAGVGSTWTNTSQCTVGFLGSSNRLIIADGGIMQNLGGTPDLTLGYTSSSSNNLVSITGQNSLFSNQGGFLPFIYIGFNGSLNTLLVNAGGTASTDRGYVGYGGSNNVAVIADSGSQWRNQVELGVGYFGWNSALIISNGATVTAGSFYVGYNETSSNNLVTVTSANLTVTNAAGNAVFDIRSGTNSLNSGTVTANRLLLTNSQGFFEFKSGTLSVGNSTVSNGRPFVAGTGTGPGVTLSLLGNGLHTFSDGLVISNGLLSGSGTVVGAVTISSGGWIALQSDIATDRLILSNTPSLSGIVGLDVSKQAGVRTNDQIVCASNLVYGGRLFVEKLGADALTTGDRFQLFSAAGYSGSFFYMSLPMLDPGLKWSNQLLVDGSLEVVASSPPVFASIARSGTNLIFNVTNANPSVGYDVLAATNVALPLSNWTYIANGRFDWLGNATITNGINPVVPAQFFRLLQRPN